MKIDPFKLMKKVFIIIGSVGIVCLIVLAGFYMLSRQIYSSTDCERFNIDHIELRTGINIPPVVDLDCNINDNIRTSWFDLDTAELEWMTYINKNGFLPSGNYYAANGEREDTKWSAQLDTTVCRLEVIIEYIDIGRPD